MSDPLHIRIERRLRAIETWPGGRTIHLYPSTIGQIISSELLAHMAKEAAKEAQDYYHEHKSNSEAK